MDTRYYKTQAQQRAAESEAASLRERLHKAEGLLKRYALLEGQDPDKILALIDSFPLRESPERWEDALAYFLNVWQNRAPHTRAQWFDFADMMVARFGGYGVTRADILKHMGRR